MIEKPVVILRKGKFIFRIYHDKYTMHEFLHSGAVTTTVCHYLDAPFDIVRKRGNGVYDTLEPLEISVFSEGDDEEVWI